MATATSRIKEIKQPRGGYIKPSEFKATIFDDGNILNESENVHGSIIGMVVDYLTRFLMGSDVYDAFEVSLRGARVAENKGIRKAISIANELIKEIKGVDKKSIINSCKLVTFDVWYRNPSAAKFAKGYKDIKPNKETIKNIQILLNRSLAFFEKYGKITSSGFTFEPEYPEESDYIKMIATKKGSYGGYTPTVDKGDGDFLTADTLWDFKVSKSKPTPQHTLQLLMYWIMGQHSGQAIYANITRLGIFNPRLNTVFLYETKDIPESVIKTVEKEVICYDEL